MSSYFWGKHNQALGDSFVSSMVFSDMLKKLEFDGSAVLSFFVSLFGRASSELSWWFRRILGNRRCQCTLSIVGRHARRLLRRVKNVWIFPAKICLHFLHQTIPFLFDAFLYAPSTILARPIEVVFQWFSENLFDSLE